MCALLVVPCVCLQSRLCLLMLPYLMVVIVATMSMPLGWFASHQGSHPDANAYHSPRSTIEITFTSIHCSSLPCQLQVDPNPKKHESCTKAPNLIGSAVSARCFNSLASQCLCSHPSAGKVGSLAKLPLPISAYRHD